MMDSDTESGLRRQAKNMAKQYKELSIYYYDSDESRLRRQVEYLASGIEELFYQVLKIRSEAGLDKGAE